MSFIRRIKRGNKIYLAEVENKRINGKVVQHHIRYIGKEVDKKTIISISEPDLAVDEVKVYGPLLVLNHISEKIGLKKTLGKYSNEILSMVFAHCLDYKSVNNMPQWFERTDLNTILNLENLTESRLLSALDTFTDKNIERYQKDIFETVYNTYSLSSKGVIYDVTNTYLYGTKCQLGKLGRSKDGKRANPLIQVGLAVTQKEGIPVFHKAFDGNIHDSRTLNDLITQFKKYNFKPGLFVYDRGITSERNISEIKELGWNTLCGISFREKEKNIVRKMLKSGSFTDIKNRITINKNVIYVKIIEHQIGKIKGKLAICYNDRKRLEIRESRYDEITNAQESIKKNKSIKRGLEKYLTPKGRIRKNEIEKNEEFDGYSCIFSTKNIPNHEIVKLYYDKDLVERAFKTLKGITNLRPIRHWLYKRVIAHIFICYLSYLLLSILRFNLKDIDIEPTEAIRALGSMYKINLRDKNKNYKFSKTVTLSKYQEKILKAVDKKLLDNL